MAKIALSQRISNVRENWNRPKEGEFVSIKELLCLGAGAMGISGLGDVVGMLGFTGDSAVVGRIYGVGIRDAYVIGIIGTIITYILMPLNAMITDNMGILPKRVMNTIHRFSAIIMGVCALLWFLPSGAFDIILKDMFKHIALKLFITVLTTYLSVYVLKFFGKKYGKFKPQMVLFGFPTLILATLITFLPYEQMIYSSRLLVCHLVTNLINMFNAPYTGNIGKVQGLVSPNSQERTKIYAIMPMMIGLLRSIYGIFFPIFASFFGGGQLNIASYRWWIPLVGGVGLLEGLFIIKVKERVVQPRDYKPQVQMRKAAKEVFSNKYLWIMKITELFNGFADIQSNFFNWIMLYGTRMEWMMGIFLNISYLPNTPGNLIAPWITRRFNKRNSLLVLKGIRLLVKVGCISLLFVPGDMSKVVILLAAQLLHSFFGGTESVINGTIMPDIWDYQQWKNGQRLEASMDLFGYFTTPVSMMLGLITPYVMKLFGLVSDWSILYDAAIRNSLITVYIYISLIGTVLTIIPYFFYDLTPDKMKRISTELQERAERADAQADMQAEREPALVTGGNDDV